MAGKLPKRVCHVVASACARAEHDSAVQALGPTAKCVADLPSEQHNLVRHHQGVVDMYICLTCFTTTRRRMRNQMWLPASII